MDKLFCRWNVKMKNTILRGTENLLVTFLHNSVLSMEPLGKMAADIGRVVLGSRIEWSSKVRNTKGLEPTSDLSIVIEYGVCAFNEDNWEKNKGGHMTLKIFGEKSRTRSTISRTYV